MTSNRFFSLSVLTLAVVALCSADVLAQPGGGRGGRGGRGFGGPGGDVAGLLQSEDVRTELEVTDDQMADMQAMGEDMRNEMRSMFEGMRDLSPEERQERFQSMRDEMEDIRAEAEERMNDILLPHQVARLKEIQLQQQVRRGGLQGALRGELAEKLGITEEQRDELVEKAQELQTEMQEKIAEMRKDAEDELMQVLTPEQRSQLKSMLGTDFEMEDRGFGRGGFGQRGGRGGGFGGQGGRRGRPQTE